MSKVKSSHKRVYVIETRTGTGITRRISVTPLGGKAICGTAPRRIHLFDLMDVPPCESDLSYQAYECVIRHDLFMQTRFARLMGRDLGGEEVAV